MTEPCPTCRQPVPFVVLGRPRRYCSVECRRHMVRLRRDLDRLEQGLADARHMAQTHYAPTWRAHYRRLAKYLEPLVDQARERVPADFQ